MVEPENPVVDIVFIHGLTGNSYKTWMDPEKVVYWPVDLLKFDIPNARIMMFGYDADVTNFIRPVGQCTLRDHATTLVNDLAGMRSNVETVRVMAL